MRIRTKEKMTVFQLMTGDGKEAINKEQSRGSTSSTCSKKSNHSLKDKIKCYSEVNLHYK